MEIKDIIKEARTKSGLTQDQVAEKILVTRQTISNWENGRTLPDIISVIKMSDLYQISLDELLKGDKKMVEKIERVERIRKMELVLLVACIIAILTGCISNVHTMMRGVNADSYGFCSVLSDIAIILLGSRFLAKLFFDRVYDYSNNRISKGIMLIVLGLVFVAGVIIPGYSFAHNNAVVFNLHISCLIRNPPHPFSSTISTIASSRISLTFSGSVSTLIHSLIW